MYADPWFMTHRDIHDMLVDGKKQAIKQYLLQDPIFWKQKIYSYA